MSYALCKMDIQSKKNQIKSSGIGVVGDSAIVQELSRYMIVAQLKRMPPEGYTSWDEILDPNLPGFQYYRDLWCRESSNVFMRDTIEHTFTFLNDEIIIWDEHEVDENGDLVGVDGTEHLGSLVHDRDIVFCVAYVDAAKTIRIDPMHIDHLSFPMYFDTLGYLPNAQQERNETILKEMLAERRYQDVFEFFKSNYHIYTCTGAEFRELVRQGLN